MQQQDGSATATHPLQVGPQPLNTPEEFRAIRQAMGEGKNPLIATDVPRWEDQVGVSRIINRRVLELEPLPTPAQVLAELPLTDKAQEIVAYSRDEIRACLYGQDDRLLVIVGPCSVHDPQAALDYAHRLAALKDELGEQLLIVTRVLRKATYHRRVEGPNQRSGYRRQPQHQEGPVAGVQDFARRIG